MHHTDHYHIISRPAQYPAYCILSLAYRQLDPLCCTLFSSIARRKYPHPNWENQALWCPRREGRFLRHHPAESWQRIVFCQVLQGPGVVVSTMYRERPPPSNSRLGTSLLAAGRVWSYLLQLSLTTVAFILVGNHVHCAPTSTFKPGRDSRGVDPATALVTPAQLRHGYNYFTKYGFLPKPNPVAGSLLSHEELVEGIRAFQGFYRLPITGVLDGATTSLMSLPRCGLPDIMRTDGDGGRRTRRWVHSGAEWPKNELSYRIMSYSNDLSEADTDEAIAKALTLWGQAIPINFRKETTGRADIEIGFATGLHRDDYPFDGPGGTLAHAFFPGDTLGGDAHFDDDERFTVKSYEGTNLFIVAAHEFGHSLGLGHSSDITSLMAAFYQGYKPKYILPYDDHVGIQELYGARSGSVPSRPETPEAGVPPGPRPNYPDQTTPQPGPDTHCASSYNAIANIRGELMLFKGKSFWRMANKSRPLTGYPIDADRFWDQLPIKIDAAYERMDSKILFFKGTSYWEYYGTRRDPSFPRPIRELGLPDDIDAALPWGETGKTYFFKGNQYWRYDELTQQVDPGYPKSTQKRWHKNVPVNMDTAFRYLDEKTDTWYTYFVRNKKYWQFDESRGRIDPGYPKRFDVEWMGCTDPENILEDTTYRNVVEEVPPPQSDAVKGPCSSGVKTAATNSARAAMIVGVAWCLTRWET